MAVVKTRDSDVATGASEPSTRAAAKEVSWWDISNYHLKNVGCGFLQEPPGDGPEGLLRYPALRLRP